MIELLLLELMFCSLMIVAIMLLILVLPMVLEMCIEEWIRFKEYINKLKRKK